MFFHIFRERSMYPRFLDIFFNIIYAKKYIVLEKCRYTSSLTIKVKLIIVRGYGPTPIFLTERPSGFWP